MESLGGQLPGALRARSRNGRRVEPRALRPFAGDPREPSRGVLCRARAAPRLQPVGGRARRREERPGPHLLADVAPLLGHSEAREDASARRVALHGVAGAAAELKAVRGGHAPREVGGREFGFADGADLGGGDGAHVEGLAFGVPILWEKLQKKRDKEGV